MRGRGLTWLDRSEDVRSAGSPGEGVCWCKLTVFGDPGGGEKLTQRFVDKRIVPIDRWGREGQLMIYQQRWRTWRVCVWPGGNSGGCLWVIPKSCGKGHFFAGSHFLEFRREGRSLTIFFFSPPESHVTEACEAQRSQSQGCKRGNCTGRPGPGKGWWQSLLVKSRSRATDSSRFHDFFYTPVRQRGKSSHLPFVQRLSLPRTFVVSPATWTTKSRTPCLVFVSIGRN